MIRDPIVEEVREIRRQTELACGANWEKLLEHYRQVEVQSGHPTTQGSPKQLNKKQIEQTI